MRLQYIAVVAVTALVASADGLQVVPNSAKSTSLRVSTDIRHQPYVQGKSDRFLISEAKIESPTKAPTGYEIPTLQEEDDDVLKQDDDDFEDGSESSSSDSSNSDERAKKRKKRKKHKATETPTPTPTATPAGNATDTPTSRPTPEPTTKAPKVLRFVAWLKRVFGD